MAMAGQGLHAAPPPRPPSHNYFGTQNNPGNQLYVGNVSVDIINCRSSIFFFACSYRIKQGGKT
jgi:hypothetical protein